MFHSNRLLRRKHTEPLTNYSFMFRRWLGRPLLPFERRIIEPLERIRHRQYYPELHHLSRHPVHIAAIRRLLAQPYRPMRIFVDDLGLHRDGIRRILVKYFEWLHCCIEPGLSTVIVHRSKKLAAEAVRHTQFHRSPRTVLCSCKRAHSVRGQTFHHALLLDADLYGRATIHKIPYRYPMTGCETWQPERTQAFRIVAGAVIAPLSTWHSSLLVIHGNPLTHPRQHYARLHSRATAHPADSPYIVISPDASSPPSRGYQRDAGKKPPSTRGYRHLAGTIPSPAPGIPASRWYSDISSCNSFVCTGEDAGTPGPFGASQPAKKPLKFLA